MLADDIESAFWVLIYEVLLYLKHTVDPNVLWKQMQLIFSDNTRLANGSVVGGHEKLHVNVFMACNVDVFVSEIEKHGVNRLLNDLGSIFYDRHTSMPHFNWLEVAYQ